MMLLTLIASTFSRHLLRRGGQLLAEQAIAPLQAASLLNTNAGTGILNRFVVTRSMSTMGKKLHEGKVAIVTASTEGIGYAIAKRLAEDGASVVVSSRKKDNVDKAVAQLSGTGLDVCGTVCHVGKDEDRKNLVKFALEKKGGVDIFVSNAAVNPYMGPFLDTPEDAWDKIFDINVKAAFLLTKEIVPHMEERGGGSIVFVSSIGGYNPFRTIEAYSVSKTALLGLTKALAQECVPMKIRVNSICPGIIQTKFSKALWEEQGIREHIESTIPLHRIGTPDECAGMVSFLCSSDASYITGENVVIAGGFNCRL